MSITIEQAAVWFEERAKNTPMPGARKMFEIAAAALQEKVERDARPQTNADRIRAMSDEELAKNLYRFCNLEERVGYCKNLSECEKLLDTEDGIPEQRCIYCLLEWLKQPAEE